MPILFFVFDFHQLHSSPKTPLPNYQNRETQTPDFHRIKANVSIMDNHRFSMCSLVIVLLSDLYYKIIMHLVPEKERERTIIAENKKSGYLGPNQRGFICNFPIYLLQY